MKLTAEARAIHKNKLKNMFEPYRKTARYLNREDFEDLVEVLREDFEDLMEELRSYYNSRHKEEQ